MDWTELKITVATKDTDQAADIAHMTVPYGFYIEDYSDLEQGAREIAHIDLIDEELLAKDRTRSILHLYLPPDHNPAEAMAFLRERLAAAGIDHQVAVGSVREEDWANNWKQYFKPLPVGERLLICPTWEPAPATDRKVLLIDPGMAFGTGGHQTTRLMLEAMERHISSGMQVLDVGCGSGILSIAALLLGAEQVTGIDIDPLAVKTAEQNGRLNGFAPPRYTMLQGDLAKDIPPQKQFDLVLANIVADAIIALSPAVPALLKEEGVYMVSGIIDTREQEVLAALKQAGFGVTERFEDGGWVCLACRKA